MEGKIKAEWQTLKKVVIHRPGIEMFFGLLDPFSSLYERAFSRSGARREHETLEFILKNEFKVEVLRLKQKMLEVAQKVPAAQKALIDFARETLQYKGDEQEIVRAKREFEGNIKFFDLAHFFSILVLRPELNYLSEKGERNISMNVIERQPLVNLYFMRDQQFVTDSGIVLCNLAKPSRKYETKLTKFFFEKILGLTIYHEIKNPGIVEGGEFIPMGSFALIGQGDRTNKEAVDQILHLDLEIEELGVVHQPMHPLLPKDRPDPMINMHLDTYFNVAGSNVVVGSEELIKNAQVDIYKNEGGGKFTKVEKAITLHDYVVSKGFHVVNLTTLEQMCYASNFLTIKDKSILAVEAERNVKKVLDNFARTAANDPQRYSKLLDKAKADYTKLKNEGQFFPHKKEVSINHIDVYPIVIPNLTGGYGAAHCMTCALERT